MNVGKIMPFAELSQPAGDAVRVHHGAIVMGKDEVRTDPAIAIENGKADLRPARAAKASIWNKSRLERQMDTLDINDAHYDRKILDLQRRYDEQYDTIEEIEVQIGELQSQMRSIQQEKISGDNIYRLLLAFDEVYHSATEAEQKEFMKAFIERIEMFPEKRKDGSWIRKIVFNFPVPVDGEEVKELPLETETTVETVCLLSKLNTMPA